MVSKGEIIGHTGSTGLAGGDHLHFSMLVQNTFVNPIEWWDAAWIRNNILTKIETVKSRLDEGQKDEEIQDQQKLPGNQQQD